MPSELYQVDGNNHFMTKRFDRKFVIGKNKEGFSLIESVGIANLSSYQLKNMVEKYFGL